MAVLPTSAIANPSLQLQAVLRWLDALTTTLDIQALDDAITEDCTLEALPRSLNRPLLDKAAFLQRADSFLMRVMKDFKDFSVVSFGVLSLAMLTRSYPQVTSTK